MEITKCEYFSQTKTDLVGEEESETEIPCRRNMVTGGDSANICMFISVKNIYERSKLHLQLVECEF